MLKSYDVIISLGGNCGAASQLRMRGLRPVSLPFDWTYMDSSETIEWLPRGFSSRFSDFCLKDNLVPIEQEGVSGLAPYKYRDIVSGYNFIHHFWESAETDAGYQATYNVLRRRTDRMLNLISQSSSVLFILATNFTYDPNIAVRFLEDVRHIYPDKKIDMHVLQHCATFSSSCILAEKWSDDMPFTGGRYARRMYTYDLSRTDTEWEFLDTITLTNSKRAEKSIIDRILFKIWKRLSKRFRNNGYGCIGIRFR
jgi:hypothetical protein